MRNIAIILPCYNEQDNILKIIKKIKFFLPKVHIYIIDDSVEFETSFLINKKKVNYYHRAKKLGRGSAVIYGLKKAILNESVQIFIEMDADFSHNPNELKKNINLFKKNKLDVLISSRYLRNSQIINWPLYRKVLSFLANYFAKKILKIPLSDYTNGFRIYSKRSVYKIIKECGKVGDGFIILTEILLKLFKSNYKISETSTTFRNRQRGESSVSLKLIFDSFIGLLKLYYIRIKYFKPK